MKKITSARITEMPKGLFDPMPKIFATLEGETEEFILLDRFYPDEISFSVEEIVGLTIEEFRSLHHRKDKHYLTT